MSRIKQIFVFTYDRYNEITTSEYLKSVEHTVLCHTKEQAAQFKKAERCYGKIVATGKPKGLTYNRNWALDQMKRGEWALFWVDDLINCTAYQHLETTMVDRLNINSGTQPFARELFKDPCGIKRLLEIVEWDIMRAEQKGYALVGFSLTDNPMFRAKRFSYGGLADGRLWAVKKTDLRFDENVQLIDDTCWTALNIKYFGGVLIDNWVLPNCKRYTPGAFGTKDERMKQKIKECAYLVKTYPQYIRYGDKVGWPKGSHVVIK